MIMAKLFYIIGPSGAGKDALINYLRKHFKPEDGIAFAHRYITRDANAGGENHVALSEKEFLHRQEAGLFSMDWQSHGNYYGIGLEIEGWLGRDINVVVNGSRSYLSEARNRFENLCPILVYVDSDVLRNRLLFRGRESDDEIEQRLAKAKQDESYFVSQNDILRVENNGSLEEAGKHLFDLIVEEKNCIQQQAYQ